MTIGCPHCGILEDIPRMPARSRAICLRCNGDLEKTAGRSITAALGCSLGTFLLLFPANIMPLIRIDLFGMHGENRIGSGVAILWNHGWIFLAGLSAVLVILLPFVRFGLLSVVLGSLRIGRRPHWLGPAFRWAVWLDRWAMLDVFLLASFVGYYRLSQVSQANISIEMGGKCFIAAALLTMLSRATLDRRTVWRAIGGETEADTSQRALACSSCDLIQPLSLEGGSCPRCGAILHFRKPDSLARTAAMLVAALVLFFPANIYPMNISNQLGAEVDYTIFAGIDALFQNDLWPLGTLIFCTSILIPVGKIFALGWCVLSVWRHSDRRLIAKTKTFQLISELGRWSQTDPFTVVFFVPILNFGALASANAGWGATAFIGMTFLSMVASSTFDPRLMWDAAAEWCRDG